MTMDTNFTVDEIASDSDASTKWARKDRGKSREFWSFEEKIALLVRFRDDPGATMQTHVDAHNAMFQNDRGKRGFSQHFYFLMGHRDYHDRAAIDRKIWQLRSEAVEKMNEKADKREAKSSKEAQEIGTDSGEAEGRGGYAGRSIQYGRRGGGRVCREKL